MDRGEISGTFLLTPYLLLIGGRGGIKMASASIPSVNEPTSLHRKAKANDKRPNLRKIGI